jgi:hypothetical protein
MVENLFYYDGDLEIKFPLHYYIASLIYYIVADKEVLRLIYVTASIFIPLLFYRCLKEKYKNIDTNNLLYCKKIIYPTKEETKNHKEYLKSKVNKNFF